MVFRSKATRRHLKFARISALVFAFASACDHGANDGSPNSGEDGSVDDGTSKDTLDCLDDAPLQAFVGSCTPLYAPTWTNVFNNELRPHDPGVTPSGCGQQGLACHTQGEQEGEVQLGLGALDGFHLIDDPNAVHTMLVGGDTPYVDVTDLACSPLVIRLQTEDAALRMPPGNMPYDAGRRCAILQWIAAGASPSRAP